jgi:hypothetical protein
MIDHKKMSFDPDKIKMLFCPIWASILILHHFGNWNKEFTHLCCIAISVLLVPKEALPISSN